MSGIGRASTLIAAGTIVSRLTGFLRSIVLVSAVGATSAAGNAFTVANQLPNNIYAIISTGLLSAVVVPQIVKAATHDDGGRAFISKLFTLGTVVLLVTAVLATLAAPWLVQLYAPDFPPDQQALATAFAYWCLPQILFYGLYALVGEALNARRVYGPFTWAPIVNNVVSIAGFVAFIVLFGQSRSVSDWTPQMVALMGATATGGIVVQAGILFMFWRRTGLSVRPDFRWRGVGLADIGRLAGWTFLMVLAGQLAGLVQSRVLSAAAADVAGAMVTANAWLLFMLPYSIIVLSIGTPYFTQLSEHAHAGRDDEVRRDIDRSIRTLGLFIVVAAAALAVAAVPASRIFTDSAAEARQAAEVLLCFLVALVPLAVLFVIQRTFYAYDDTRTPFWFTLVQCVLVVVTALGARAVLPVEHLAAGIALGQSLASIVQVVLATWLLRRRLGALHLRSWLPALARFIVAAAPAALVGGLIFQATGGVDGWMAQEKLPAVLGAGIIGVSVVLVYVGALALLRAPELSMATSVVRRLLPGRRG
ncbi:murein biosynthesis integral membrane protein MurJ [Microbacterium fluvii]|uniref:Murein biosynthesis integral membrane protein MurJ n=1 Tax=Microbacterium fluvii TaxID=415215 RepID=A0ABW2HFH9_9MICO|nr:murein biosynthesis integral membrane protein MurJ [Microbacterium fluvii]MCU4673693.1 murein biosynthesis integral membrane protein MurJ [Microbacterium fluvii]